MKPVFKLPEVCAAGNLLIIIIQEYLRRYSRGKSINGTNWCANNNFVLICKFIVEI